MLISDFLALLAFAVALTLGGFISRNPYAAITLSLLASFTWIFLIPASLTIEIPHTYTVLNETTNTVIPLFTVHRYTRPDWDVSLAYLFLAFGLASMFNAFVHIFRVYPK